MSYLDKFYELKDEKHASFSMMLTPGKTKSIGIKTPLIKSFVKELDVSYEMLESFELNKSIEEDILYGLILIKLGKEKDDIFYKYLDKLVYKIDNWQTCDTFTANTKFKEKDLDRLFEYTKNCLNKKEEFVVRVGLMFLKKYFLKTLKFEEILSLLDNIEYGPYYIDMGAAWLFCTIACTNFDAVYNYLPTLTKKSYFVMKKTVQKMKESYLITDEQKEILNEFLSNMLL